MTDLKGAYKCEKRKLTSTDFLPTCLMAVAVILLFALVTWEFGKVGGALDKTIGATVQEMKSVAK